MLKREMPPVHPGNVLKELYMEPLGTSVTDLAASLGVHRRTISLLINEHSGVNPETALRLEYDLWHAG
jgi:addiction module HigA family antidote